MWDGLALLVHRHHGLDDAQRGARILSLLISATVSFGKHELP
jgi:inhibitor of KinA sporulation pathway (predicted exonuclease)